MNAAIQCVRLGAVEVDLRSGELRANHKIVRLQEQPFQILLQLIESDGELVTREELQRKLWPNGTIVDFDHSINTAIKKLRQAFGESADDPKYVETVSTRGYRLLFPVQHVLRIGERAAVSGPFGIPIEELRPGFLEGAPDEAEQVLQRQQQSKLVNGDLVGKAVSHYRVLGVLGGGGMGVLYKAEDLKLRRQVVLKFLPEELAWDPVTLGRFRREALTISMLDHPNICTLYELGDYQEQPFLVMQFLEGATLRERLTTLASTGRKLPLQELVDIAEQICDGLQAAHDKGIIHRDINPANIFLTSAGPVKILDFGLAKVVDVARAGESASVQFETTERPAAPHARPDLSRNISTRLGKAIGTVGYMSPEQVRGEKLDVRSDIFCLGLVLYEMSTGQRAFHGDTPTFIQAAILSASPPAPCDLNSALPSKMDKIIFKALEKSPAHRYRSATEVRDQLKLVRREGNRKPRAAPALGLFA